MAGIDVALEIELKYDIASSFCLPDLSELSSVASVGDPTEFWLDATYYDTDDLRLASARITLRRRRGGHDAGWHLKRPADGGRSEASLPETCGEDVPEALATRIRAIVRDKPLRPVVRIRTRRRERALRDAHAAVLALVAEDEVESEIIGGEQKRWRELEVELVDGGHGLLTALGGALERAGARDAPSPSKLARALGDRYPRNVPPDDSLGSDAGRALMDYLRRQVEQLIGSDPAAREGDADGVHDMRVATRRLRSTLGTFGGMLANPETEPLRADLRWIAGLLGAVRDGDVIGALLARDDSVAAPDHDTASVVTSRVRERLAADAGQARQELGRALNSGRYLEVLDRLDLLVGSPAPDAGAETLRKRTRKHLRRADRDLQVALHSELAARSRERDRELHEARKAYKNARYAVEVLAPLHGKPARRLVERLRALQDMLGEHQDATVAANLLLDLGEEAHVRGDNAFGFGVLYAHQAALAAMRRQRVPRLRRRASRRSVREWLDD